jgi:quercetin dioxygenase-like cupin family protein
MRRGTNESEHAHPYDQWVLTLKGMARFTCGGEVFIVKRGDVLKIPAGVRHSAYYITDTEAIAFGLGQD